MLGAAGYAQYVIDGVISYIRSENPQTPERMAPAAKKPRVGDRRSTIPVAPSVKKYVKNCMKRAIEKKYITVIGGTNVATTAGLAIGAGVESIQQGTTDSTRVGSEITLSYVTVRGTVGDSTASPGPYPEGWIRMALVYDRQANGAAPTVSDIATSVYAPWNHNAVVGHGGGRFQILKSKIVHLKTDAVAQAADSPNVPFVMHHKFKGEKVRYQNSTGTLADVLQGTLYLVTWGQNATIKTYTVFDIGYLDG